MAQKLIRTAIIIVSVLLAISLLVLGWTFLKVYVFTSDPAYVVVPDNYIKEPMDTTEADTTEADTTEADTTEADTAEADTTEAGTTEADTTEADTTEADTTEADTTEADTTEADTTETDTTEAETSAINTDTYKTASVSDAKATVTLEPSSYAYSRGNTYAKLLTLKGNGSENLPFNVTNMFPGDSVTNYYCVCVTYRNSATLNFEIKIREGYEKLAEVLEFKVEQISEDKVIHEGIVEDMYFTDATELTARGKTTEDVYYKITASLDTSVGNDYMNKELVCDFRWWIETEDTPVIPDKPDTSEPDTSEPDMSEPDTSEPDTSEPDTSEPDTSGPDTSEPDTSEPDTSEPDTSEPDTSEEDTTEDDHGHEHAPQTGDRVSDVMYFGIIVCISMVLLLILLILLILRKDEDDEEE